jgi:carbonic anhydrase
MGDYSTESPSIRRELDGLHLSLLKTGATTGSEEARWQANVVGNVHQQVANALQQYAAEVRDGTLTVVGAVYDFRNDLGKGEGRLVVVDVNGETDTDKLAGSPLMKAARAPSP